MLRSLFRSWVLAVWPCMLYAQAAQYGVQVGAFEAPVPLSYFKDLKGVYQSQDQHAIYRYYIDAASQAQAEQIRQEAIQKGFAYARVVDFAWIKMQCEAACAYQPKIKIRTDSERRATTSRPSNGTPPQDLRTTSNNKTEAAQPSPDPYAGDLPTDPSTTTKSKTSTWTEVDAQLWGELDSLQLPALYFEYDRSQITPTSFRNLQELALWLRTHPETTLRLEAHADSRGAAPYNQDLSWRRAMTIRDYFAQAGIATSRVTIKAWGEEKPLLAEDGSEKIYQIHRRVDLFVLDAQQRIILRSTLPINR